MSASRAHEGRRPAVMPPHLADGAARRKPGRHRRLAAWKQAAFIHKEIIPFSIDRRAARRPRDDSRRGKAGRLAGWQRLGEKSEGGSAEEVPRTKRHEFEFADGLQRALLPSESSWELGGKDTNHMHASHLPLTLAARRPGDLRHFGAKLK